MKTNLPQSITTITEAEALLKELYDNGEAFHPEDDVTNISWDIPVSQQPTKEEGVLLNKLMEDIYNLDGNNGNHANPKWDPCKYLMQLYTKNIKNNQSSNG